MRETPESSSYFLFVTAFLENCTFQLIWFRGIAAVWKYSNCITDACMIAGEVTSGLGHVFKMERVQLYSLLGYPRSTFHSRNNLADAWQSLAVCDRYFEGQQISFDFIPGYISLQSKPIYKAHRWCVKHLVPATSGLWQPSSKVADVKWFGPWGILTVSFSPYITTPTRETARNSRFRLATSLSWIQPDSTLIKTRNCISRAWMAWERYTLAYQVLCWKMLKCQMNLLRITVFSLPFIFCGQGLITDMVQTSFITDMGFQK